MLLRTFRTSPVARSLALTLAFTGTLFLASGCSFLAPSTQEVTITVVNDPQAEIVVGGQIVGYGTAVADLEVNRDHTVVARSGDVTQQARVKKTISEFGILDIIGGVFFLFPFIGIVAPGFWKLRDDNVTLTMPQGMGGPLMGT